MPRRETPRSKAIDRLSGFIRICDLEGGGDALATQFTVNLRHLLQSAVTAEGIQSLQLVLEALAFRLVYSHPMRTHTQNCMLVRDAVLQMDQYRILKAKETANASQKTV